MIREWLATWRRHRAARRGERAWFRDRRRHPDERIKLRDEQIVVLREQNSALTAENAQLRVAIGAAVMSRDLEYFRQIGAERARRVAEESHRIANEPTVQARAMGRAPGRPAPATEQYDRRHR